MVFARIMLTLGALTFLGIGVLYLLSPQTLNVYAGVPGPGQKTEIRAIYGGLELGVGAFCVWALSTRARLAPGLILLGLALTGISLGRIIGLVVEGSLDRVNTWALAGEGAGAVLCWWALFDAGRGPGNPSA